MSKNVDIKERLKAYAPYMIESIRESLGYKYNDDSHDEEVLAKLVGGEKLSKSKHM